MGQHIILAKYSLKHDLSSFFLTFLVKKLLVILRHTFSVNTWKLNLIQNKPYICICYETTFINCYRFTWSGARLKEGFNNSSSRSLISSSYPNFRRTVHVVSKRPRSINKAWRKRKPVNVSPLPFTPSGIFSDTTFFTPTTSAGCKGALKHLTCSTNIRPLKIYLTSI